MKLLETEWITYRNAVIPKEASAVQLTESRRMFYAGAWSIYQLIMNRLDPGVEATDADLTFMSKLHDEMVEFKERVKRGHA